MFRFAASSFFMTHSFLCLHHINVQSGHLLTKATYKKVHILQNWQMPEYYFILEWKMLYYFIGKPVLAGLLSV